MKLAIVIIALVCIGAYQIFKSKDSEKASHQFVTSTGDISPNKYCPEVNSGWILEKVNEWKEKEYSPYQNLHFTFADKICHDVYNDTFDETESHFDYLSGLNDIQKMYFAMLNFEGQTNNGGVYQFLFNQPENAIITFEAMKTAKLNRLSKDYEIVLEQFLGKFKDIEELKLKFQNTDSSWKRRWNSFVEGRKEIPQADEIDKYFYDKEYIKSYHHKMAQFVIDNQNSLLTMK